MLKKFGFSGSYSYKDWVELDMSAELSDTSVDYDGNPMPKQPEVYEVVRERIPSVRYGILPVAAIYGKNAAGKTNLIKALIDAGNDLLGFQTISLLRSTFEERRFRVLGKDEKTTPLKYSICVAIGEKEYTLSYEMINDTILSENVFYSYKNIDARSRLLYSRSTHGRGRSRDPQINKHIDLMKSHGENQLWFPLIAPVHDDLKKIHEWLSDMRHAAMLISDNKYQREMLEALAEEIASQSNEDLRKSESPVLRRLLSFLKCIDNSIVDVSAKKYGDKYSLHLFHREDGNGSVALPIENESAGTIRLIQQFPLIDEVLRNGVALVCDEFDLALHPVAFRQLVQMFNNPAINESDAQLIFTAHNTIALDSDYLRRDQVHIVDKDEFSVSTIKRLSEMEGLGAYPDMEHDFRTGFYGSFPKNFNKAYRLEGDTHADA